MRLKINGIAEEVAGVITLKELLAAKGMDQSFIAVAVNEHCIPLEARSTQILSEGDTVEIVAPMQGG